MRKTNVICSCGFERPQSAEFCPGCGSRVSTRIEIDREMFIEKTDGDSERLVNLEALENLVERGDADLDEEVVLSKRIGPAIGWGASTTAVLITLFAAFWIVNDEGPAHEESTNIVAAAPIDEPIEFKPQVAFTSDHVEASIKGGLATVEARGATLLTLREFEDSRYETMAERAKSVELRLRHVADDAHKRDGEPGKFLARRNGEVYEVVWTRPAKSDFRIIDVTERDVKAWKKEHGETSRSILANVIADELNAALYAKPIPTS